MSWSRWRRWLWIPAIGLLFAPLLPNVPLQSGPYVQNVTHTSAVVARIAPSPVAHLLELRDSAGAVLRRVSSDAARRHAIELRELSPGTRYRYALYEQPDSQLIGEGSFSTAPDQDRAPVRFTVTGDSGHVPPWGWLQDTPLLHWPVRLGWLPPSATLAAIGTRMAAEQPDLWFHVGDVIYPRGEHRHWGIAFFRPYAELLAHAPCFAVAGNHDLEHDGGRPFQQNLILPGNDVSGDERMFSFAWGPIRFIGLDTNERLLPGHPVLAYAERELAAATEPWRIVIQHHPWWSASRQGDRSDLVMNLLPLLRRHGVDLVFCGNDHNYQRFGEPGEPVLVVTGGGGKSLYPIGEHRELRAAKSAYEYCAVEVAGAQLTLRVVDPTGKPIDTLILDKRRLAADGKLRLDPTRAADRRLQALLDG